MNIFKIISIYIKSHFFYWTNFDLQYVLSYFVCTCYLVIDIIYFNKYFIHCYKKLYRTHVLLGCSCCCNFKPPWSSFFNFAIKSTSHTVLWIFLIKLDMHDQWVIGLQQCNGISSLRPASSIFIGISFKPKHDIQYVSI